VTITSKILLFVVLMFGTSSPAWAQTTKQKSNATAEQQVITLLREFLSKVADPAMHERFWADDVVYTGSNGKFRSKAEIVKNVREGGLKKPGDPEPTYGAEDITTHVYGDTVVVAFRLVHHAGEIVTNYRNTGTFLRRNGQWQVVAWQATKVPEETPPAEK